MKILLTGATGQIGYELLRTLQGVGEIAAPDRHALDCADLMAVRATVRALRPDLIINAAAYTAVDQAESAPHAAQVMNADLPAVLAEEGHRCGAAMIHYSTDYVFDGTQAVPYAEDDLPRPRNVYGRTKLAGEHAVAGSGLPHLILRTSWVYGLRGKNFLQTMLQRAHDGAPLRVVNDQWGAPTWSRTVAEATAHAVVQSLQGAQRDRLDLAWWQAHGGVYHLTAQGRVSWHGFAEAILRHAGSTLPGVPAVTPIASDAYPTAAVRPRNASLSCEKFQRTFCGLPDWESALQLCMT